MQKDGENTVQKLRRYSVIVTVLQCFGLGSIRFASVRRILWSGTRKSRKSALYRPNIPEMKTIRNV